MNAAMIIAAFAPPAFGKAALFALGEEIMILLLAIVFIIIPLIATAFANRKK
jgi:hypothetical protein